MKKCDLPAMKLMLALRKTTSASSSKGNNDLLELAMGRCQNLLPPLIPSDAVTQFCAVDAWSESRTRLATLQEQISEIDRRVRTLRRSPSSENGKSCLSSYAAKRVLLSRAQ